MGENEHWHKVSDSARNVAPFLLVLLLTFISVVPLQVPGYSGIAPPLALLAIFYWGVYRPELLPAPAVALLGALQDILTGAPLGQYMLIYLLVQASLISQRQLFLAHAFFILWWGYALIALLAAIVLWLIAAAVLQTLPALTPFLLQACMGIALFPLVAWLCHRLSRLLADDV